MPKHIFAFAVLALFLAFAPVSPSGEARMLSVAAIAETGEYGQIVTGLRIEYPAEVRARDLRVDKSFAVDGRRIIGVFVNNDGSWHSARPSGRYVFLKFAVDPGPGGDNASTIIYYQRKTRRLPIHLNIRQKQRINLSDGTHVIPGGFTNTAEINILADDFLAGSFTDSNGYEIKYRLFVPKGYEARKEDLPNLPLVLFLHGGGEHGTDNQSPLMANPSALEYAKPEAQDRHPAFVLVPQAVERIEMLGCWTTPASGRNDHDYVMTKSLVAAMELLKHVMEEYNVDSDRIYGTGLSQGSRAIWLTSMLEPDLYAAQLHLGSADLYSDEQAKRIVDKPIWSVVAADDLDYRVIQLNRVMEQLERLGGRMSRRLGGAALNGYLRGYLAAKEARAQWDEARAAGMNLIYTHLADGTVVDDPHMGWMWAYSNEAIRDWMFAQRRGGK